jgi:hypothetical protein
MYDNVVTSVRTSDEDTNDFQINIGLHQGSALSPYLFVLVMDEVTKDIHDGIPWCMLFADHVVLVDESRTGVCRYPTDQVPPRTNSKKGKMCARTQPRAPRHQTSPPGLGEFECCHASRGTRSHRLAPGGLGAATRPVVPAPASRLGTARVPQRIPWY